MGSLYVLDVSAIVHTGVTSPSYRDNSYYGFPTGGILYLNKFISSALARQEDIVLAFDSPSFRNDLLESYKSGRVRDQSVVSQIETVYEMLSSCGLRCEKYDGYEADDIIEWAVADNCKSDEYYRIYVIGNDYDLCHSIRPNVEFIGCSTNVNSVDTISFPTAIVQGVELKYNTVSAYKCFCGCHSDKIPGMVLESGVPGEQLYGVFVDLLNRCRLNSYERTSSPDVLRFFANKSGVFTQNDLAELEKRIKLVFPAEKPRDVIIKPNNFNTYDKMKLAHYFSLFGDVKSLNCFGFSKVNLTNRDKDYLKERGRMLASGMFAADNNLPQELESSVNATCLSLDAFSKDF